MADVLQEINFNEEVETIKIAVSYIIRSDESTLESISKELGLEPSRLWNKDEAYLGKQ